MLSLAARSISRLLLPYVPLGLQRRGERRAGVFIDSPEYIFSLGNIVAHHWADICSTDHTFSGSEIALWDLLGKKSRAPF